MLKDNDDFCDALPAERMRCLAMNTTNQRRLNTTVGWLAHSVRHERVLTCFLSLPFSYSLCHLSSVSFLTLFQGGQLAFLGDIIGWIS